MGDAPKKLRMLPVEHDPFNPDEQPPYPGAVKAPDGHWYSRDPRQSRKGKWMRLDLEKAADDGTGSGEQ